MDKREKYEVEATVWETTEFGVTERKRRKMGVWATSKGWAARLASRALGKEIEVSGHWVDEGTIRKVD